MASPSGSANGGILGVSNKISFGKNKTTTKKSTFDEKINGLLMTNLWDFKIN